VYQPHPNLLLITLDRAAKTGTVGVTIEMSSIDTGNPPFDKDVKSDGFLDVDKHPTATFKGTAVRFHGNAPVAVAGDSTRHGVTKPMTLKIESFKCFVNPMLKLGVCGGDASAQFDRVDYGMCHRFANGRMRFPEKAIRCVVMPCWGRLYCG